MHRIVHLSNCTRVVLVPHRDTAAATILVLYEVGSRYERHRVSGASHFIEHMMFKGTKRRPTTLSISRDLDAVGADYNAFTGKDYTGYYIRLQADKLPLAVDMLEDMLYHSNFSAKEINSERKVIHEEIRMYDDNPAAAVDEILEEELYRGSPLGWKISGTVETMMGIGRADLIAHRDAYYIPSRTVIAVAGRFDEESTLAMLEEKFGGIKEPGRKPRAYAPFRRAGQSAPLAAVRRKDTEQVQVSIGFPGFKYKDPQMPAATLMSVILGGTMSSRLFTEVRERRGLAYTVRSSVSPYQDCGDVGIQAGLAKDRVHQAVAVIMRELKKIAAKKVSDGELTRAKENIKGRMSIDFEDSSRLADWYGRQELLTAKIETPEDRIAMISAVSADDIRAVAEQVFNPKYMAIAVVGPFDDPAPFSAHAKIL
ncbi:MAG: pitrilysin family protein [Patescibacteria group bacterium]